jgi:bifunctional UDP-N-acetylglucosamine pyrophosphorylase/glucosamine-1-phosphate N-acetyltransferase
MTPPPLNVVILAAGKGTRMRSSLPKVLHTLAGKSLLRHVIDSARQLAPSRIIVIYGYGGDAVRQAIQDEDIVWVEQREQLGTGHAVQQAAPYLEPGAKTLILLGDVPLLQAEFCRQLLAGTRQLGLLTVKKNDPTGYGRIVRGDRGNIVAIVEHRDATPEQLRIDEVNTGIMAVDNDKLQQWLLKLNNDNAQGEYYLTDIVAMAVAEGLTVHGETVQDESSVEGVNSKQDLAGLERVYQMRKASELMRAGVTLRDPFRIDIRGELESGSDVEIDVGCIFEGKVVLGDGVKVGAYSVIRDSVIGAGTAIAPFTHIEQSSIAAHCRVGPYARLRPGTALADDTHIGNFVELKNAVIDTGSKINHLSYVGDATVGKQVNIGAGTITCNYDGANKHRTVIEDHAFIGSDTQLIAPVTVGAGATIGAGSTISRDAPAGELTLSRSRQITVSGWKRPVKNK